MSIGWLWRRKSAPLSTPEQSAEAQPVSGFDVLEKLAELPISTWNYKGEDSRTRHMGPMAQDFAAAFGLGDDDRRINMVDANGVAMVAIQALYRRVQELEAEVAALRDPEQDRDAQ